MKRNAGKHFPLEANDEILRIDSPHGELDGPWFVVHKDITQRWAIVIMHWNGTPCLGIRWFLRGHGTPSVRGYATWLVVPNELADAVLSKLPIAPIVRQKIDNILLGKYSIKELRQERMSCPEKSRHI